MPGAKDVGEMKDGMRKQRHILADTVMNLHQKYHAEAEPKDLVSLHTFCYAKTKDISVSLYEH